MVKTLLSMLNKPKKQPSQEKCYYCGNSNDLIFNPINNTFVCRCCSTIIKNTRKELVAC